MTDDDAKALGDWLHDNASDFWMALKRWAFCYHKSGKDDCSPEVAEIKRVVAREIAAAEQRGYEKGYRAAQDIAASIAANLDRRATEPQGPQWTTCYPSRPDTLPPDDPELLVAAYYAEPVEATFTVRTAAYLRDFALRSDSGSGLALFAWLPLPPTIDAMERKP